MQTIDRWLKVALLNLSLVAVLGITMRYKIAFSLRFIDQKNLMHAHSHFAFSGWVTQALMILLLYYLHTQKQDNLLKRYKFVLLANVITAYAMLITFPVLGYTFFPILFSTLSIFVSYIFAMMYWRDLNKLKEKKNCHLWFKASLIWNVLSSVGPFTLAFMLATHHLEQKLYLGSVFTFLHFQYNGWFLFACMGLLIARIQEKNLLPKNMKTIFVIFAAACIPSLFLSMPWLALPAALNLLDVLAAFAQLAAWIWFIRLLRIHHAAEKFELGPTAKLLLMLAAISFTIKLVLQLCSSYHPLSQLVFGFRPIVIGYLHLIFLGIITVFIFGYLIEEKLISTNKKMIFAVLLFVSGIFINEIFLMMQGIFDLLFMGIPFINIYLLIAAIIIFLGILLVTIFQFRAGRNISG